MFKIFNYSLLLNEIHQTCRNAFRYSRKEFEKEYFLTNIGRI
jgi:hypothetical protein